MVDCYIWYSEEGTGRGRSPPRPPPRCTICNSPPTNGECTNNSRPYSFIHSFIAICRAHYVKNVESEALEAVARWSVIGKVVSFYLAPKAVERRGLSDRKW